MLTSASIRPVAAVVAVGTELAEGLREDTNGAEVARSLVFAGFVPQRHEVLPDDREILADRIAELTETHDLVVVTGGLGPTHDDLTREAAADALGLSLVQDPALAEGLVARPSPHTPPHLLEQVMRQTCVLKGATTLIPPSGSAPGQIVATPAGYLVLLPGPPHEMRPLLAEALEKLAAGRREAPRVLGCVGISESDAQMTADRALQEHGGIRLALLARPAIVDIVLIDEGAGESGLDAATHDVALALGDRCYATDGSALTEVVIREAIRTNVTIAVAESCTGGMLAQELTAVPGSSATFVGGVVAYSNGLKTKLLRVDSEALAIHGAVSPEVAQQMAQGVKEITASDFAVSVTGIAGPGGATPVKPVGTVWFCLLANDSAHTVEHRFPGDRADVRARATATALDLLRNAVSRSRGP